MPTNVNGNSSSLLDIDNKNDTSLFVQKPHLRTNYIESNIEEDLKLKNQYRNKFLPDQISIRKTASKIYVEAKYNDPSIIKATAHFEFNDKNLHNVHSIKKKLVHHP